MSRVPADSTTDVKQAFIEVWEGLDGLLTRNIDLHGRRIINAGKSRGGSDYITRSELVGATKSSGAASSSSAASGEAESGSGLLVRLDGTGTFTGARTVSGVWAFNPNTGTVPFTTTKTGMVANLNADLLDGVEGSGYLQGTLESGSGNIMRLDGTTDITGNRSFTGAVTLKSGTPLVTFQDTTGGHDNFDIRVDASQLTIRRNTAVEAGIFTNGEWQCLQLGASNDVGGTAGLTSLTNATDTPTSGYNWNGTGSAPDGYLKMYLGSQAIVVPYWNT